MSGGIGTQAALESLERNLCSEVLEIGPREDVTTIIDQTEFGEREILSDCKLDLDTGGVEQIGERRMDASREVRELEVLYVFFFDVLVKDVAAEPSHKVTADVMVGLVASTGQD